MEQFERLVDVVNGVVWSNALIILLVAVGIYFSIRMRFFQVRLLGDMVRTTFKGDKSNAGISSFQALVVSLSGRVGTGNIAGVATAIYIGGPGAVFWMWLVAFLGASSAFVESTLGQIYKREQNGQYRGGPSFYIEKGFKNKSFGRIYSIIFAVATILAMGFLLPSVQSNSIASAVHAAFQIDYIRIGVFITVLLGVIIFGGIKTIARVAEYVVPFMAVAYILLALTVIVLNIQDVPEMFRLIFSSAFGAEATFGGIIGSMIVIGIKRGVYSNEAGQGSGAHAAAAAEVSHPAKQGLVQAFSVYIDTLFVCSATAFMILMAGTYNVKGPTEALLIDHDIHYVKDGVKHHDGSPIYTQAALDRVLAGQETFDPTYTGIGSYMVAIALFFFAFTTLMLYYYVAETNITYLFKSSAAKIVIFILKISMLVVVFLGCIHHAALAWNLGDLGVGIMAWLNIIAILILQRPALRAFKDYERQRKQGLDPTFDPKALGIENAEFWEKK
jgi:AGCS family alanine or glycine:cation symporter